MSTLTPNIGLKKPDGTDPFLTNDFDANYTLIDSAIKALQDSVAELGGGGGSLDAATLQTHPASYFYSAGNPPPGGGGGAGNQPNSWSSQLYANSSKGVGTTNYLIKHVVVPAAGVLNIQVMVYVALPSATPGLCYANIKVDDVAAGYVAYAGVPDLNISGGYTRMTIVATAQVAVVTGNHSISFDFVVSTGPVTIVHWRSIAVLAQLGTTY